jgi:selenide,water dikinase
VSGWHMTATTTPRLTGYAHGGGCACKIPPGELESVVAGLIRARSRRTSSSGSETATTRVSSHRRRHRRRGHRRLLHPVVDDPYDWGASPPPTRCPTCTPWAAPGRRGQPARWPRDLLPMSLAAEVLRGGLAVARQPAATSRAGTASTTRNPSTAWPSPVSPRRIA